MLGSTTVSGLLFVTVLREAASSVLSRADLSFNPIRLALLVGWVYLCVYFVQRVYFSPLVPKNYKTMANVVTLFTGPFLLLILFVIDAAKKTRGTGDSFLLVLKRQIQQVVATLHAERSEAPEDSTLRLLDSSGRSIDEICGHGDRKHEDARILNLTEATIADALERRASDILIDPKDESTYTVRLRVDGMLRVAQELNAEMGRSIISSVKAVAGMDISERRRPQDGGFTAKKGGLCRLFPRGQRRGPARGKALDPGAEQGRRDILARQDRTVPEAVRRPGTPDRQAGRHDPDLRAYRQRQDHDPVRHAQRDRPLHPQRHHRRGPH
jgi:hypothetical protein